MKNIVDEFPKQFSVNTRTYLWNSRKNSVIYWEILKNWFVEKKPNLLFQNTRNFKHAIVSHTFFLVSSNSDFLRSTKSCLKTKIKYSYLSIHNSFRSHKPKILIRQLIIRLFHKLGWFVFFTGRIVKKTNRLLHSPTKSEISIWVFHSVCQFVYFTPV